MAACGVFSAARLGLRSKPTALEKEDGCQAEATAFGYAEGPTLAQGLHLDRDQTDTYVDFFN